MNRLHSVFTVLQYVVHLKYKIYFLDFNELNLSYSINVFKHESIRKKICISLTQSRGNW